MRRKKFQEGDPHEPIEFCHTFGLGGDGQTATATDYCAIRCRCRLLCCGKTWSLAGMALDRHLVEAMGLMGAKEETGMRCHYGTLLYDYEDCICDQDNGEGWWNCPYNDPDPKRRCSEYPGCKYGHPATISEPGEQSA
jgi:hypothetical protein